MVKRVESGLKRRAVDSARPASPPAGPADDRRQYHQAREAFEYAYSMLEPFFHPETGWQGRSLHHVSLSMVGENFPHLAHDEVDALLEAVRRVFLERNGAIHAPPV